MLKAITEAVKSKFSDDTIGSLILTFIFLHFYYAIPEHGILKSALGAFAGFLGIFLLSLVGAALGQVAMSAFALSSAALALDIFYRGQMGNGTAFLAFQLMEDGPAVVNFATFACASAWFFAQVDRPRPG